MNNTKTLIELKNIAKKYDTPSGGGAVSILKDISLKVNQGVSIAIAGPSGSGKSTLLNIMGALDKPNSGGVFFEGRDLTGLNDNQLAEIRNRDFGFIFQLHHLLPQCTVLENVLIPTIPAKTESTDFVDRAKLLLKMVGLEGRIHYFPAQLSGGEQQRVAVVRALINKPRLVLADEPTGSLDSASAENLGQLLIELNKTNTVTLVVVTHSINLARRMDQMYNLKNGKLEELS